MPGTVTGVPPLQGFKAGGTIGPGLVVKLDTAADNQVIQCTAITDQGIGIAPRALRGPPGVSGSDTTIAAIAGDGIAIFGPGSVAPAIAGAAITRGSQVGPNASAQVITTTGATTRVLGFALESASGVGVEIDVLVWPFSATVP